NHGIGHDGSAKRSSDPARRPADRAGRTNDRQGSDALPRTAGAPSESRSSSPRATSGSSVPGQSRAARSRYRRAAGERARSRGPRTDQSSAANDRLEHAFRVKIRRTGHPARPDVPPSSHSPPASTTRANQRSRILAITSFSTKSARDLLERDGPEVISRLRLAAIEARGEGHRRGAELLSQIADAAERLLRQTGQSN